MDEATQVRNIIGPDLADQLTPDDIQIALTRAQTPDDIGRPPGTPGWEPTVDLYWAAAEAITILAIRETGNPQLTKISSEGTTFEQTPPDLWKMAHQLRRQSPLWPRLVSPDGLGIIEMTPTTAYRPTSGGWPAPQAGGGGWQ